VTLARKTRVRKILEVFRSFLPALFFGSVVIPPILWLTLPFVADWLDRDLNIVLRFDYLLVYLYLLFVSAVSNSIACVVWSEPASFAGTIGARPKRSRLASYLEISKHGLFHFLAYESLFEAAEISHRRPAVLSEASPELCYACFGLFKIFRTRYAALAHLVRDARDRFGPRRPQVSRRLFGSDERPKPGPANSRLELEIPVLEMALLIVYASRSLVGLARKKILVEESLAEGMADEFAELDRALTEGSGYAWAMEAFGRGWFVRSPRELMVKTHEVVGWAARQLGGKFGRRFDVRSPDASPRRAREGRGRF